MKSANIYEIGNQKPTQNDIHFETLKIAVSELSSEDRDKTQEFVNRFTIMLNKGGRNAHLAFAILAQNMASQ